jgi:hypothetical protein
LKLNGTHQLLVYAADVTVLDGNINSIKQKTEAVLQTGGSVGLEVNTGRIKFMVMFLHRNTGQNRNLLPTNKSSENLAKFKYEYFVFTKKLKSRLNLGNAFYHCSESFVFQFPL